MQSIPFSIIILALLQGDRFIRSAPSFTLLSGSWLIMINACWFLLTQSLLGWSGLANTAS